MNQSLSVVLPVYNAQATLARQVDELLDVLPDLTDQFEVVIVDDGSNDHTEEISHDLARQYPQLRIVRNNRRHGAEAALQTALDRSAGDVVFVQDAAAPVRPNELERLWELRNEDRVVTTHAEPTERKMNSLVERLVAILRRQIEQEQQAAKQLPSHGGVSMLRRREPECHGLHKRPKFHRAESHCSVGE